jgi:hypothetical protein
MNPLHWHRSHQLGFLTACIVGGLFGLLFAWLESPFRTIASHSMSGEWSDYSGFSWRGSKWVITGHGQQLGAVLAGLIVYTVQLLRDA